MATFSLIEWWDILERITGRVLRDAVEHCWKDSKGDVDRFRRDLQTEVKPLVAELRRFACRISILAARQEALNRAEPTVLGYLPGLAPYPSRVFDDALRRSLRVSKDDEGNDQITQPTNVLINNVTRVLSSHVRGAGRHTMRRLATDSDAMVVQTRVVREEKDRDQASEFDKVLLQGLESKPDADSDGVVRRDILLRRDIRTQIDELEEWDQPWLIPNKSLSKKYAEHCAALKKADSALSDLEDYDGETARRLREARPRGWARVLRGETSCGFCVMLAARGPVYSTAGDAGQVPGVRENSFHDGCDCMVVPVYDHRAWLGRDSYRRLSRVWQKFRDASLGANSTQDLPFTVGGFRQFLADKDVEHEMARIQEGLDPWVDEMGPLEPDGPSGGVLLNRYLDKHTDATRWRQERSRALVENPSWREAEELPRGLFPDDLSTREAPEENAWAHFTDSDRKIAQRLQDELGLQVVSVLAEGDAGSKKAKKALRAGWSQYQRELHGEQIEIRGVKTADGVDAFGVMLEFKSSAHLYPPSGENRRPTATEQIRKATDQSSRVVLRVVDPEAYIPSVREEFMTKWVEDFQRQLELLIVLWPGGEVTYWHG